MRESSPRQGNHQISLEGIPAESAAKAVGITSPCRSFNSSAACFARRSSGISRGSNARLQFTFFVTVKGEEHDKLCGCGHGDPREELPRSHLPARPAMIL
jgi:hypothetical protein